MHRNEVVLVGRLSLAPASKELASGTVLTQWRLAVRRPPGYPGFQRSDAIECATFDDGVREALADWRVDDIVQVEGAIRRRWWRGGNRYEVEVRAAHRVGPVFPSSPVSPSSSDASASRLAPSPDVESSSGSPSPVGTGDGPGVAAESSRLPRVAHCGDVRVPAECGGEGRWP